METVKKQSVIIESRENLTCDKVIDVEEFSGEYVIINTDNGKLTVDGENLRIKELNEKEGKISITGKISGAFFKDASDSRGFFKRKK